MYKNKRIVAVVPAYNESKLIVNVIDTIPSFVDKIVIINDFSEDETSSVVRQHPEYPGKIVFLEHEKNQGVGAAIATGYKWARENDYDAAVVVAGDGQMSPKDMQGLLDPIVEELADYSKGNRFLSGEAFKKMPKARFFGNLALSLLTKIVSGYWHLWDSQCGYTVINRSALRTIKWDQMYKRYGQPNDLLVKLNIAGMKVVDVPVEPVYNVGEQSGVKIRIVIFTITLLLLRLFFFRLKEKYIIRDFHLLILFCILGLFSLVFSAMSLILGLVFYFFQDHFPSMTLLIFKLSFGVGLSSLIFALWLDYGENKHLNFSLKYHDIKRN